MAEIELVWAIVVSIILIVMVAYFIKKIKRVQQRLDQRQTNAYNAGISRIRGEITQILAGFSILNEYNQIGIIGSISKNVSLDLLGIKDDSVDFIEVKSQGSGLSPSERKVKELIDNGKVRYRIIDGDFPDFKVTYRT